MCSDAPKQQEVTKIEQDLKVGSYLSTNSSKRWMIGSRRMGLIFRKSVDVRVKCMYRRVLWRGENYTSGMRNIQSRKTSTKAADSQLHDTANSTTPLFSPTTLCIFCDNSHNTARHHNLHRIESGCRTLLIHIRYSGTHGFDSIRATKKRT